MTPELTVAEQAALTSGSDFWHTTPVESAGIPAITLTDGPHGVRLANQSGDMLQGQPATCFPPAAATASTWDADLLRRMGEALGDECRAMDVAVLLGPGVNLKRSPLCGRNFEYFSEDPFLAGELAVAWVNGLQSRNVGASLKHFAVNNQETDRLRVSADVDERTLRELYLSAFRRVMTQARPWTVMAAYNKINGVYATEHHWLLTEVARGEWGWDGLIMSDWGAVADRVAAVAAGTDLTMPGPDDAGDKELVEAVASGRLDQAVLARAAQRVRALIEKSAAREKGDYDPDAHGLSYTTFSYGQATARVVTGTGGADGLEVRVSVTNTGDRDGREVVQVYVGLPGSKASRAKRELKAFASVPVKAGETQEVVLAVARDDLAYWDTRLNRWVVEGGDYQCAVGASSRDLRTTAVVAVAGDDARVPLTAESTLGEWFADERGASVLAAAFAGLAGGEGGDSRIATALADPTILLFLSATPMVRMAAFPGSPLTPEVIAELVAKANG